MASFGIFGEAIYQILGNKQGDFLKLYDQSIKKNLEVLYENNPIIPCLDHILDDRTELDIQANDLYRKIRLFADVEGFNTKRIPQGSNTLQTWFIKSKTLLDENKFILTRYINKQSKQVSGFTPNSTIYNIKRTVSAQTKLKDELDV